MTSSGRGPFAPAGNIQLAKNGAILWYADHLRYWQDKLSQALYRQANVGFMGDSLPHGAYSNDAAVTDEATWRERSVVAALRDMFAVRYGAVGEGFIQANDVRFTRTGGAVTTANKDLGVCGAFLYLTGPANQSPITLPLGTTAITVIAASPSGSGTLGDWRYDIDGGGTVVSAAHPAAGTEVLYTQTIAGLDGAVEHTFTFIGPAAGAAFIVGIQAWAKTTSGVAVHRAYKDGTVLFDQFAIGGGFTTTAQPSPSANNNRQCDSVTSALGLDLVIICLDANNTTAGWTNYAITPAQYGAQLQTVVNRIVSKGIDVLLMTAPPRDPTFYAAGIPYTQADYQLRAKTVAGITDRVAYADLTPIWKSYTDGNARGLYQDSIHQKLRGHQLWAKAVYQMIGEAA